jgi:hypothetical protein
MPSAPTAAHSSLTRATRAGLCALRFRTMLADINTNNDRGALLTQSPWNPVRLTGRLAARIVLATWRGARDHPMPTSRPIARRGSTPTRPTPNTASPAAPRSGSSPSACFASCPSRKPQPAPECPSAPSSPPAPARPSARQRARSSPSTPSGTRAASSAPPASRVRQTAKRCSPHTSTGKACRTGKRRGEAPERYRGVARVRGFGEKGPVFTLVSLIPLAI